MWGLRRSRILCSTRCWGSAVQSDRRVVVLIVPLPDNRHGHDQVAETAKHRRRLLSTPSAAPTPTVTLSYERTCTLEDIARLVGHRDTTVTELVYRNQLRPVTTEGAETMNRPFKGPDDAPKRLP